MRLYSANAWSPAAAWSSPARGHLRLFRSKPASHARVRGVVCASACCVCVYGTTDSNYSNTKEQISVRNNKSGDIICMGSRCKWCAFRVIEWLSEWHPKIAPKFLPKVVPKKLILVPIFTSSDIHFSLSEFKLAVAPQSCSEIDKVRCWIVYSLKLLRSECSI